MLINSNRKTKIKNEFIMKKFLLISLFLNFSITCMVYKMRKTKKQTPKNIGSRLVIREKGIPVFIIGELSDPNVLQKIASYHEMKKEFDNLTAILRLKKRNNLPISQEEINNFKRLKIYLEKLERKLRLEL